MVAADLVHQTQVIKTLFGLEECYRDPNVGRYGLQNVLFPIGTDFIEIVSPTRPGTAAGRFLERHAGRHGYMIIMDCDDPERRQKHCEAIGVRTANLIRHENYLGVQLHPKDTGGAMLEFNRTVNGEDAMGSYAPAGPAWQQAIRQNVTGRLLAAEFDCPDPRGISARWSEIVERPVEARANGRCEIALDTGVIAFLPADRPEAVLAGIEVRVASRTAVMRSAKALGCMDADGSIRVSGMRVRLSQAT